MLFWRAISEAEEAGAEELDLGRSPLDNQAGFSIDTSDKPRHGTEGLKRVAYTIQARCGDGYSRDCAGPP